MIDKGLFTNGLTTSELDYYFNKGYQQGRADAIEECIAKIDTIEQISFGIVETDLVKSMLEQLKEQKNE